MVMDGDVQFVEINDSLINFRHLSSECDSTWSTYRSINYEPGNTDSQVAELNFKFKRSQVNSKFELIHENSAIWVWTSPEREDSLFITADRTDLTYTENISESKRRLSRYQSSVYEKADSLSQLSNRLAMTSELSTEAADVVDYIDTLRHRLLDPLKEEYSSVKCAFADWKLNENSRASDTLVGKSPNLPKTEPFSANKLKEKLQVYSGTLEKEIFDVFPDFDQNHLGDQIYYRNNPIHWETFHFYNVPMGLTILKLNEFELNIYRIEKLRSLMNLDIGKKSRGTL
jgi:hypothetical protein